jgi:hypothetical protein
MERGEDQAPSGTPQTSGFGSHLSRWMPDASERFSPCTTQTCRPALCEIKPRASQSICVDALTVTFVPTQRCCGSINIRFHVTALPTHRPRLVSN